MTIGDEASIANSAISYAPRIADYGCKKQSNTIERWRTYGFGLLHIIRRCKIFRIFSGRYRNRTKRCGLRLNLIAGLLNYELAHAS